MVYCVSGVIAPVHASTDPQYSTGSATATVPSVTATTEDELAPTAPILVRPEDGTTTGDNQPEFVWKQSSDPNGNTITYTFYLNGVATYLGISSTGNSSGLGYTAHLDGQEVKLRPTSSLADGEYDWYVVASDGSGNTTSSTSWHFLIDTAPPDIYLTDVDIYHNLPYNSNEPESFQNLIFDIAGPKTVYLTLKSEAWSTLTLSFYDENNLLVGQIISTLDQTGLTYPSTHLELGKYLVRISSYDRGGNTTALPDFSLNLSQAKLNIPLPNVPGLPAEVVIPYTPYTLPSFPATISKIESRLSLTYLSFPLLAVIGTILIIFIWKRKYNIIFLNDQGQPYSNIKAYHSIPTDRTRGSNIFVTRLSPISYFVSPSDHGRLYIEHLGRYSTLTVKLEERTYILSLSVKRKLYTLVLS